MRPRIFLLAGGLALGLGALGLLDAWRGPTSAAPSSTNPRKPATSAGQEPTAPQQSDQVPDHPAAPCPPQTLQDDDVCVPVPPPAGVAPPGAKGSSTKSPSPQ